MRTYKIREARVGPKKQPTYSITIPAVIARLLIAADQMDFTCELTEDGLLFKPVSHASLPSWVIDSQLG